MNRILYIILSALILSACTDADERVMPPLFEGDALIGFTLTLGDEPGAHSRTPGDGPYDPGTGYENIIDIPAGDFRFLFFTTDDTYAGQLRVQSIIPLYTADSRHYQIRGYVSAEVANTVTRGFKVCALANWANNYPELQTGDPISELWEASEATMQFEQYNGRLDEDHLIPLYGIHSYEPTRLSNELLTELGTIDLIRAFAKIDVVLDYTVLPVESITVARVNSSLLKAPRDITHHDDYVHGSYPHDYISTPSIPHTSAKLTHIPMYRLSGEESGERIYRIYLPEYANTPDARTWIEVNYAEPSLPAGRIDLRYYQDTPATLAPGAYFDLLRNNWYRFNCRMTSAASLDITVDVQPFAAVDLHPLMGLERDENGNIIVRNSEGEVIKIITTVGQDLDFKPIVLPGVGESLGVFDEDRVLIVELPNGDTQYYNYEDVDDTGSLTNISIETYNAHPYYLKEETEYYVLDRTNSTWNAVYINNFYCSGGHGHLIEQYTGGSRDDFKAGKENVIQTVRYTLINGYYTIIYRRASDGKDYMKIEIDPDGNETYTSLENTTET